MGGLWHSFTHENVILSIIVYFTLVYPVLLGVNIH